VVPYEPTIPAEQVAAIRHWHERAYAEGRADARDEQVFDHLGTTIVVPPEVMPITPMSHLLGEAVLAHAEPGGRVLDMGTGSGVNAILAATKGCEVVAVDINPVALEAALANAARNGVADRIDIHHSDVFSAVDGVFDLIVFDPPFRWFRPRDRLEAAMADENYRALAEFFAEARSHLAPGGRMLVFFGTSGDLGHLHHLIDHHGFRAEVVAHDDLEREGWTVDYYTFLVA
jgi:release factor glutamine methyltransferase